MTRTLYVRLGKPALDRVLAAAMLVVLVRYLADPALRHTHGAAGRARAERDFRPERIWTATRDTHLALLTQPQSGQHRRSIRSFPA